MEYKVHFTLEFDPDTHFGVDRSECRCGVCPDQPVRHECFAIVRDGDVYEDDDGEEVAVADADSAAAWMEAQYEGDSFDEYSYVVNTGADPNGNGESEFGDGFGTTDFDVVRVEVIE